MPGFELWGAEERAHLQDVLDNGILMRYGFDGPRKDIWKSKELEKAVCATFGVKHAQLVSSGTAALTTAMSALGIGYGDEVIMPSFTFVASFEAVLSVGAVPVLVDVDDTLTLAPAAVKAAITPQTKCIMPVHMCGSMADLGALQQICAEHKLILLEDACQSIGGTYHGHDHKGVDRGADLHPFIGYNFRISELNAAVGLAQIKKLPQFLAIQKRNNKTLRSYLEQVPGISFRVVPDPEGDNASFLSWFLPTAEQTQAVVDELKAQGILAGNFYWFNNNWHYIRKWDHLKFAATLNNINPLQKEALDKLAETSFPVSDGIMSRCISTAISLSWTEEQLKEKGEKMLAAINKALLV